MELNKHICNQLVEKDYAFAQITLDDDYIVRDNKPDILRAIYTKGSIVLEDTKIGNQVVWITGKLYFHTLYLSQGSGRAMPRWTFVHTCSCAAPEGEYLRRLAL